MPASLVRRLVMATAISWVAVRLVLAAVAGMVALTWIGVMIVTAVVVFAVWSDLRRSDATLLLANLAVSPVRVSVLIAAATVLLELMVGGPLASVVPVTDSGLPS